MLIYHEQEYGGLRPLPRSHKTARLPLFFVPALLGSRAVLAKTNAAGPYSLAGRALIWTAGDPAYGNRFTNTGKEFLLARNTGSTPWIVTVKSAPDIQIQRLGDQVLLVPAGEVGNFGPFPVNGWRQSDGYTWVDVQSSDVQLAVVILP